MSLGVALLLTMQGFSNAGLSAAGTAEPRRSQIASSNRALRVTAAVKIMKPVTIRVERKNGAVRFDVPDASNAQTRTDEAGTFWIEFS